MFPSIVVDLISKASPILGSMLGGPAGALVGSLISKVLGVDMNNRDQVQNVLQNPDSADKLKELEIQVNDLQDARLKASKETGYMLLVRPIMALVAMIAIFVDIFAIEYVTDDVLKYILIVMLVFLVFDVRKTYDFYFGKGDEIPSFLLKKR